MKYNAQTLKQIETLCKDAGYTVRYEKGHFQSGYCIVKEKRVIVVNKFYTTEARITCLVEILDELQLDESALSPESLEFYQKIKPVSTSEKKG